VQGGVLPAAPQVPTTGSALLLHPKLGTGRADPTGPGQDEGGQSRLTAARGLESQPGGAPTEPSEAGPMPIPRPSWSWLGGADLSVLPLGHEPTRPPRRAEVA
jgi:hypothetical protein